MKTYKFYDIKIGLEESFSIKMDASKLDKFLDISNDINPLYVDSEYAQAKGFEGRVVYGFLTSTFYSNCYYLKVQGI